MSIPASQLRIGNYIFNGLYPEKVTSDTIWSMDKTGTEAYGVELTHEILEKAGFENDFSNEYSCKYNRWFMIKFDRRSLGYIITYMSNANQRPSKYLHELQNLFFSLTGQELQINL
jgi:hypothetical protein